LVSGFNQNTSKNYHHFLLSAIVLLGGSKDSQASAEPAAERRVLSAGVAKIQEAQQKLQ
jgi:hypothetical protein